LKSFFLRQTLVISSCLITKIKNPSFTKNTIKKMKKILIVFVAGCIPALAAMNGAYAQSNNIPTENIRFNKGAASEKISSAVPGAINTRAAKHFSETYKNAAGA